MGTRSAIGVMHGDKCKAVYCHWDGYLDHNGRILLEHYDSSKANHLVALGDLSSLGTELGEKHPFGEFDYADGATDEEKQQVKEAYHKAKKSNWCTFYKRDREEKNVDFQVSFSDKELFEQFEWCEYFYVMKDGIWYVSQGPDSGWKVLADAIREEDELGYTAPYVTGMLELA